jgi:hypothetical protein
MNSASVYAQFVYSTNRRCELWWGWGGGVGELTLFSVHTYNLQRENTIICHKKVDTVVYIQYICSDIFLSKLSNSGPLQSIPVEPCSTLPFYKALQCF